MTTATNEGLAKTVIEPKKKRTLSEKVNQVNKGWGILDELGENRFQIPDRKKAVDLKSVEGNIANIARADAEIIKSYEAQGNASVIGIQKEIQAIQQAATSSVQVVKDEEEKFEAPKQIQILPSPSIAKTVSQEEHSLIQETPVVQVQKVVENVKIQQEKKMNEKVMSDKNLFFKMVMRGLAQLYVDKTTSLFNPVVFIAKNYKFLLQTTLLLGVPALITWYLFTRVTGLQVSFNNVSTFMYCFYAAMFYTATLFLCLTLQVFGIGFWAMLKKSMSEVAVNASNKSEVENK